MSDRIEIGVLVEETGWNALTDLEALARRAVGAALCAALPDASLATLAVVFDSDAEIRILNRTWRGQDKPTNVLSFPGDAIGDARPGGPPPHLGDVILAWPIVADEAAAQGKKIADHTAHLIVHGVLHLLGYDHEADDEAERMEALETSILSTLGIRDPYWADSPATNPREAVDFAGVGS